jgi:hypothetical protein
MRKYALAATLFGVQIVHGWVTAADEEGRFVGGGLVSSTRVVADDVVVVAWRPRLLR